jgi:hypothetical protein
MSQPKENGMPKIKREHKIRTQKYNELYWSGVKMGDKNDCAVRAIAVVTGLSYAEAHAACAAVGRKPGRGMMDDQIVKCLNSLGFDVIEIDPMAILAHYPPPHNHMRSITSHQPERFKEVWKSLYGQSNLLLFKWGHVGAYSDGVVHDWMRGTRCRMRRILQVVPQK